MGRALNLLADAEFSRLFETFEHTSFRLETRDRYNSPQETEPLRRFLTGEPDDPDWHEPWLQMVRTLTAQGRRMSRVRVVTIPLTDYSRFAMHCSAGANSAGEDIRYLRRNEAGELPDHDFWLFDSRTLLRMHFGDDDVFLGGELVTDPVAVVQANYWRDAARHRAALQETFTEV